MIYLNLAILVTKYIILNLNVVKRKEFYIIDKILFSKGIVGIMLEFVITLDIKFRSNRPF